jgi:hypothetical protein
MKRFALAGLLALAATFAVQQQASAGFGFNGSIGLSYSFNCYCNCPQSCGYGCAGPSYAPPVAYSGGYGYDPASAYPAYAAQYPVPQAAPAAVPQATATPVGYYYYPYGYGYQTPSYWYGR